MVVQVVVLIVQKIHIVPLELEFVQTVQQVNIQLQQEVQVVQVVLRVIFVQQDLILLHVHQDINVLMELIKNHVQQVIIVHQERLVVLDVQLDIIVRDHLIK
jgi:hypothetical protein